MKMVIYHNPKCSKSRQTLEIIKAKGVECEVIEYLKDPLSKESLEVLAKKLAMRPRDFIRTKEQEFEELGLNLDDDEAVFGAMVRFPKLMERPIVTKGERGVIGRPPENVNELF